MKSSLDAKFIGLFDRLPAHAQKLARQKFALWQRDTNHPSLEFKELSQRRWSVRVGDHYRAVGIKDGDEILWFWIGTHEKYNNLLGRW